MVKPLVLARGGGQAAREQRVRLVSVLEGGKVQQAAVLVAQMPKARPPAVLELLDSLLG